MIKRIIILILLSPLLDGCNHEENYPAEPTITFEDLRFVKENSQYVADTIWLTFTITDGDKDFGLDSNNPEYQKDPFQPGFYVKHNGELVSSYLVEKGDISWNDLIKDTDRETP